MNPWRRAATGPFLGLAMLVCSRHGCDPAELHAVFAPVATGSLGLPVVQGLAGMDAGGTVAEGFGPTNPISQTSSNES